MIRPSAEAPIIPPRSRRVQAPEHGARGAARPTYLRALSGGPQGTAAGSSTTVIQTQSRPSSLSIAWTGRSAGSIRAISARVQARTTIPRSRHPDTGTGPTVDGGGGDAYRRTDAN